MIIMMAANKMIPTAPPLASSPALALDDGYASSVIANPSSASSRHPGRPIRMTDRTVPPSQGEGIILLG
jgi:hypothetical protein